LEELSEKICPKCGSKEYSAHIQGGENSSDSFWECNDCGYQNRKEDDDKIDSFDYDQGYNLDEVYDQ
jgi:DNA-directed RNA polymerase subunit M/transcription elongation factor TFIIS